MRYKFMGKTATVMLYAAGFTLVAAITYGMALAGEPQADWLWGSVLGLL